MVGSSGKLEPALLPIPVKRSSDSFTQADPRCVPELVPCARYVERAALRKEIHAPAIHRRLDAERGTDRFTYRARGPEGPDRQMDPWHRHAGNVRNNGHKLVQRRDFAAGQDVGPIRGARVLTAEAETLDEVVDVRQMVIDVARSKRDPPAPR